MVNSSRLPYLFFLLGLVSVIIGMLFGIFASLQFIIPDFFDKNFPFYKNRPLHVTYVISWIFFGAMGSIYFFLPKIFNRKIYSERLGNHQFWILFLTGIGIFITYILGIFSGREYLDFSPWFSIPVLFAWILLAINFFKTAFTREEFKTRKKYPVYIWMWATGIILFIITFSEAHLWLIPYFRNNIVRDISVQWKSYGALIGSWNMLVYGTAFVVMEKIEGNSEIAYKPLSFFFYFIGLVNALFNWGHHTYHLPQALWIKEVAFIISMTELLILGKIIWDWMKSLKKISRKYYLIPRRFLYASDFWILLNLTLAILISVPVFNTIAHGTHVIVAHAMGSTIGINTAILFASLYYVFYENFYKYSMPYKKQINIGFWIFNISLLVFWVSLILAGIIKGLLVLKTTAWDFQEVMSRIKIYLEFFSVSGIGIFIGLLLLAYPPMKIMIKNIIAKK